MYLQAIKGLGGNPVVIPPTEVYAALERNKEGLQVISLPAVEKEKFLQVATEEGWKDVLLKNPQSGPELKKLLTRPR